MAVWFTSMSSLHDYPHHGLPSRQRFELTKLPERWCGNGAWLTDVGSVTQRLWSPVRMNRGSTVIKELQQKNRAKGTLAWISPRRGVEAAVRLSCGGAPVHELLQDLAWSMVATGLWRARSTDKACGSGQGRAVPGGKLCRSEMGLSGCALLKRCWRNATAGANRLAQRGSSAQWWQRVGAREMPSWPQKPGLDIGRGRWPMGERMRC
jgi:hypothetical protein